LAERHWKLPISDVGWKWLIGVHSDTGEWCLLRPMPHEIVLGIRIFDGKSDFGASVPRIQKLVGLTLPNCGVTSCLVRSLVLQSLSMVQALPAIREDVSMFLPFLVGCTI